MDHKYHDLSVSEYSRRSIKGFKAGNPEVLLYGIMLTFDF